MLARRDVQAIVINSNTADTLFLFASPIHMRQTELSRTEQDAHSESANMRTQAGLHWHPMGVHPMSQSIRALSQTSRRCPAADGAIALSFLAEYLPPRMDRASCLQLAKHRRPPLLGLRDQPSHEAPVRATVFEFHLASLQFVGGGPPHSSPPMLCVARSHQ